MRLYFLVAVSWIFYSLYTMVAFVPPDATYLYYYRAILWRISAPVMGLFGLLIALRWAVVGLFSDPHSRTRTTVKDAVRGQEANDND